jgi:hypothetical protein
MTTGQAHIRAEFGVNDLDPASGRSERGRGNFGSGRAEQPLTLGIRD